jgi:hypothetical protein
MRDGRAEETAATPGRAQSRRSAWTARRRRVSWCVAACGLSRCARGGNRLAAPPKTVRTWPLLACVSVQRAPDLLLDLLAQFTRGQPANSLISTPAGGLLDLMAAPEAGQAARNASTCRSHLSSWFPSGKCGSPLSPRLTTLRSDRGRRTRHARSQQWTGSASNTICRRVRVACAKRSRASVEGRALPPSISVMAYVALRDASTNRSHPTNWFQLAKMRPPPQPFSSPVGEAGNSRILIRPSSTTAKTPAQSNRIENAPTAARAATSGDSAPTRNRTTPEAAATPARNASSPKSLSKVISTRDSCCARASTSGSRVPGASSCIHATSCPARRNASTAGPGTFSSASRRAPTASMRLESGRPSRSASPRWRT